MGETGIGNGGKLLITMGSLNMINEAGLSTSTSACEERGNAGNIHIFTNSLKLSNSSKLTSDADGIGNVGSVTIEVRNRASRLWKKGDPIVEPQGVFRLLNGQLVMSRECQ